MNHMIKNQNGMSLVQVMVAFALMGVLAVFMMQLMKQGTNAQKTLDKNQDMIQEISRVASLLKDNETCDVNFQNLNLGGAPYTMSSGLKLNSSSTDEVVSLYDPAKPNKLQSGLKIKSMQIVPPTDYSAKGRGEVKLNIQFQRDNTNADGTRSATASSTLSAAELTRTVTFFAIFCQSTALYATSNPSDSYTLKRSLAIQQMEAACPTGYIDEDTFREVSGNLWIGTCLYNCGNTAPIARCDN
jgi:type II secretory pathway pseudopilin PulG